jgi:uncharacterized phage-like protein YoqJ
MLTVPVWVLLGVGLGVALWIARLVKDLNNRFDSIENALELILDHLKNK